MHAQTARREEGAGAGWAGVGPLPGVAAHVTYERALVPEPRWAEAAGELLPFDVHLKC